MQEAVLTFLVQQVMTNDETAEQRKIFYALDDNNDGQLSKDQVVAAFRKYYGAKS